MGKTTPTTGATATSATTPRMISVGNVKRACLAALAQQAAPEDTFAECRAVFTPPQFFIAFNDIGFSTGVDKRSGTPCFLLTQDGARRLLARLEASLSPAGGGPAADKKPVSLAGALALIEAGLRHQPPKYESVTPAHLVNEQQYRAAINSFPRLARQTKGQALYDEVAAQLADATELATPLSDATVAAIHDGTFGGSRRARVRMVVALDFEFWERSTDTILEVGWSLWDTLTQRHRTRHWVIKENLNKHNGGFVSDNRMNLLFGTSERGSLERAFDALQAELDARGVTDGLDRQEKDLLSRCDIDVVLVGHAMSQDQEQANLFEIEWPAGMRTFDTQRLFIGHQLDLLDAQEATRALQQLMARKAHPARQHAAGGGIGAGAPPKHGVTLEQVERYTTDEEGEDDSDGGGGPGDDLDSDDSDYGLPGAVGGLGLAGRARPGTASSGGSGARIAAVQPPKPKAVQGPVRVRPWPAGPLPSERADRAAAEGGGGGGGPDKTSKDRIQRQISLAGLLGELGIKSSRLHNAGNDARFTMEAFLSLTGHPACRDPVAAHTNRLAHDPRYQQQLEACMQAAAEQGWGAPMPRRRGPKQQGGPGSGGPGAGRGARAPAASPAAARNGNAPANSPYLPNNQYQRTEDSF